MRYEYSSPLYDATFTNSNLVFQNGVPKVFLGGQNDYPKGLLYSNKHDFAPRIGIAKQISNLGLVVHASYGIFFTPVDGNTWCNQRHNVPNVFPETQQADNFTPPPSLFASGLNFGSPVLGNGVLPATTVSFTAFDPHAPAQYCSAMEYLNRKEFGAKHHSYHRIRWRSRFSPSARASHQQSAARTGSARTAPSVQNAYACTRHRHHGLG